MDVDIAWEECVGDLPLDTKNLPPLNALSSTTSANLPDIDLLELLTFDHTSPESQTAHCAPDEHDKLEQMCAQSPEPTLSCVSPATHSPHNSTLSDFLSPLDDVCKSPSETSCADRATITPPTSVSPTQSPPSSPTQSDRKPACDCSAANGAANPAPCERAAQQPPPLTDQSQLVLELSTRLASAGAEATALRKRVAALSAENRSLRAALDHANARLIAVAQAASAPPAPATATTRQAPPVMLGLAHVTTDVAGRIAGALTVSDTSVDDSPRDRKKRKRMTGAATTMACVMFMWGALIATPAWLSSPPSATRSQPNLPAVWKGDTALGNVPVPSVPRVDRLAQPWQPNCMRVLEQLPDGSESAGKLAKGEPMVVDRVDDGDDGGDGVVTNASAGSSGDALTTRNEMMVDVAEDKAAASVVARTDLRDPRHPHYSYVLCRDAQLAMDNLKACTSKMHKGQACGEPHTISLILPAEAAGLDGDENDTSSASPALAEVQCSIMSVARIPVDATTGGKGSSSPTTAGRLGRIIATVPETGTVITNH